MNIIKQKNIYIPSHIKEYFVCSKKVKKYPEIAEVFSEIKKAIMFNTLMFKKVEISPILEKIKRKYKK